jgi:uncharacterized cupin superfamily protein
MPGPERSPNLHDPDWDMERDEPPFVWRRARLARQAGASKLGASLFEVPSGAATFQLHVHHANEELVFVLSGRVTLSDGQAERELGPGAVVACPAGAGGAHRLDNRGEEPARILIVSTMLAPDVTELREDGQVWVRDYAPGSDPPAAALDRKLPG